MARTAKRDWLPDEPPAAGDSEAPPEAPAPLPPRLEPDSLCRRALDTLSEFAGGGNLSATLAPTEPKRLAVEIVGDDGHGILLSVEEKTGDGQYCRHGNRLGFWYDILPGNDAGDPRWLTALLDLVDEKLTIPELDPMADEIALLASPPQGPTSSSVSGSDGSDGAEPSYDRAFVLGPTDVERFFHVDYEYEEGTDVDQPPTCRIGVIYQCNQWCAFCQLAEMNTHIPPARIRAALDASRERGAVRVIFTGGEPTMCRDLADYFRYAKSIGFTVIELQTNATLLDDARLADKLREAGLTHAQVSLHGPDAEISDRLTVAPGTHRRTLAGITNLLERGVCVLLNHLIFRDNAQLMPDFVEMVERLWGKYRENVILQFHSPLNEFAHDVHARKHIARYTEYADTLCRTIDQARELGYDVQDLQDPTGIPALCVVGLDEDYLGKIASQEQRPRFHRWESEWVTRVDACLECDVAQSCMGIPKAYLALYGDEEFHSVKIAEPS